ncbi:Acylphosphatase-domain-containing protein [Anaeromyces robustus]|uniref:Acylphosphatase n=1 Tax=Anaeromyces robustus TaxID=1754192 RepID=A0A1Y1XEU1_9FUNG|nr:Acylphosphatase-domain-containing protein [Anaeromyces robustus]|eukprot:ORX84227.1 Acylphosphatase-domain-containing protein [Anaeromyces robustus]
MSSIINLSKTTLTNKTLINCTFTKSFSMLSKNTLKTNEKKKTLKTTSLLSDKKKFSTSKVSNSKESVNNSLSKKSLLTKKSSKNMSTKSDKDEKIVSINFEVFGKVQGVFFRKYTKLEGKKLGLRGWCMNTTKGTVQGLATGKESQIEKFKTFLQTKGSPKSRIDHAEFSISDKEATETDFVVYRC